MNYEKVLGYMQFLNPQELLSQIKSFIQEIIGWIDAIQYFKVHFLGEIDYSFIK